MVLKFVLHGRVRQSTNQVLIYTDTLPMQSKAHSLAVHTTIKAACQKGLGGKQFKILHHSSESNYWLQVVDYCSWSVCRKWENADVSTYEILKPKLAAQELEPMARRWHSLLLRPANLLSLQHVSRTVTGEPRKADSIGYAGFRVSASESRAGPDEP
jgi:hypothetical protein